MREKTRDALQKALFEALFVVLAVALALAANEWRQGVADERQASAALASIVPGGTSGIMERYVNLSALISTFSYRESQLLEQYDEMLAALGHAPPAEAPEAVAVDE